MAEAIGIDIGNGFCWASIINQATGDIQDLMSSDYHRDGLPSTVFCKNQNDIVIGHEAEQKSLVEPGATVYAVKRRLAEKEIQLSNKNGSFSIGPEKIYAELVRETVKQANREMRLISREPVYQVVVSYPADYCNDEALIGKIKKAVESVEVDGNKLKVVGMLPEPAAVALDYLYYQNKKSEKNELTAVVYDLGHGSFDSALVKVKKNTSEGETPYDILYKSGRPNIGGYSFNVLMKEHIEEMLAKRELKSINPAYLINQIEDIKRQLSISSTATGTCLTNSSICLEQFEISRSEFEELIAHLLEETYDIIDDVISYAEDNSIKPDFIVISGGSGNIPVIREELEKRFSGRLSPAENGSSNIEIFKASSAVSSGNSRYASGIVWPPSDNASSSVSDEHSENEPKALEETLKNIVSGGSGGVENTVLTNRTSHEYGVLIPSEKFIYGKPQWLIINEAKLPAYSKTFEITALSNKIDITVIRPPQKEAGVNPDLPYNLINFEFDGFKAGTKASFCLAVTNELEVSVICRTGNGESKKEIVKNSFDRLKNK